MMTENMATDGTPISEEQCDVVEWILNNILQNRERNTKSLYIYGPTGIGKSTLIDRLSKFVQVFYMARGEDFYDLYNEEVHELAVLDEFKANKTIQWMNTWLDGSRMNLRVKGGQMLKKKNIPTIILSNYSLRYCYCNVPDEKFRTIQRRLMEIDLTDTNLYDVCDWLLIVTGKL